MNLIFCLFHPHVSLLARGESAQSPRMGSQANKDGGNNGSR